MWSRSPKKELGGHNLSLILVQITWRWQQFLQRKKGQCLRALGRPGVVPPQCMAPISQIPTLDWALRHQVYIAGTSLWRRWGASVHNPLIFIEAVLQSDQYKQVETSFFYSYVSQNIVFVHIAPAHIGDRLDDLRTNCQKRAADRTADHQ